MFHPIDGFMKSLFHGDEIGVTQVNLDMYVAKANVQDREVSARNDADRYTRFGPAPRATGLFRTLRIARPIAGALHLRRRLA